jgi:hypothetical protein
VQIGINNNASAQVLSGLKPGERVVIGDTTDVDTSRRRRGGI